jgi:copper chaperone
MGGGHCTQTVTRELSGLPGVNDVAIDPANGRVTISSTSALPDSDVQAAIEEAGYQVAR